jgi:EpsI family protein
MISTRSFIVVAVGLLMTLIIAGALIKRPIPVVVRTNLENLPMGIAGYVGIEDEFPESVNSELNADKHVFRHYRFAKGDQIDLYIGYYGTAKGGRTGHNPYACLPGAGWAIVDSRRVGIRQPCKSSDVPVNYVQARRNGVNIIMVHWYQSGGTTVMSSGVSQNIERFWGRLLRNRNDGAYVQISTEVSDDRVADAGIEVKSFAGQILRLLPLYWPKEE